MDLEFLPSPLPRVTEPPLAPSTLQVLLEDLGSLAGKGDLLQYQARVKDALGFSTRYFAGVCVAACRHLGCLPGEVAQTWSGSATVEQAQTCLAACLEKLKDRPERLAQKLAQIFYQENGIVRAFARCLGLETENPEFRIAEFCGSSETRDVEAVTAAARALDGWMSACFSFFLEAEQRFEPGPYFGQFEQAVQFDQYLLRTELTVRVREARYPQSANAPLAPDPLPMDEGDAEDARLRAEQAREMAKALSAAQLPKPKARKPRSPGEPPAAESSAEGKRKVKPPRKASKASESAASVAEPAVPRAAPVEPVATPERVAPAESAAPVEPVAPAEDATAAEKSAAEKAEPAPAPATPLRKAKLPRPKPISKVGAKAEPAAEPAPAEKSAAGSGNGGQPILADAEAAEAIAEVAAGPESANGVAASAQGVTSGVPVSPADSVDSASAAEGMPATSEVEPEADRPARPDGQDRGRSDAESPGSADAEAPGSADAEAPGSADAEAPGRSQSESAAQPESAAVAQAGPGEALPKPAAISARSSEPGSSPAPLAPASGDDLPASGVSATEASAPDDPAGPTPLATAELPQAAAMASEPNPLGAAEKPQGSAEPAHSTEPGALAEPADPDESAAPAGPAAAAESADPAGSESDSDDSESGERLAAPQPAVATAPPETPPDPSPEPLPEASARTEAAVEAAGPPQATSPPDPQPKFQPLAAPLPEEFTVHKPAEQAEPLAQLLADMLAREQPRAGKPAVQVHKPVNLELTIEPLGYSRNSQGKVGYTGVLWVSSTQEDELVGAVTVTNPNIEVEPPSFLGTSNRLVYWVDPEEAHDPRGEVVIKAGPLNIPEDRQERILPLWRFIPHTRLAALTIPQLLLALFAPGLLGTLYSVLVFFSTSRTIDSTLHKLLGPNFDKFFSLKAPLSLRSAGVGVLDLKLLPAAEGAVLLFFLLAWLTPVVVGKIYMNSPRHHQRTLAIPAVLGMILPTFFYVALWSSPLASQQTLAHPELVFANFRTHMNPFLILNLFSTIYTICSILGVWNKYLNELGRFALASFAALGSFLTIVMLVYFRSWFGY